MDRLENGLPKKIKKRVKYLLGIVEKLEKEQKEQKKLSRVERVIRSISHKIYPFSNECLTAYLSALNLKNKNVMVVGSSGDQALCASFYGAKEVCLIDANPLTKPFFDLKLAALKNLSYEDFINYFLLNSENAFSIDSFNKLKKDLPIESRLFWEIVYDKYEFKKIRNFMFQQLKEFNIADVAYLKNEESFNHLKDSLGSIKFEIHTANVSEFHRFAKQKNYYSLIMLSNICDYIPRTVFKDCVRNLLPYLTEDGVMQAAYEFVETAYSYSYLNGFNYYRFLSNDDDFCVVFLRKEKQKHKVDDNGKKVYKSRYDIGIEQVENTSKNEY